MAKALKHIHKYYHAEMKYGNKLWTCALPDCGHHMPVHYENTLLGKLSLCWSCDKPFVLNIENMKDDQPICMSCAAPNLANDLEDILFKGVK